MCFTKSEKDDLSLNRRHEVMLIQVGQCGNCKAFLTVAFTGKILMAS
jgi:hypothetical protein